jgi:Ser/Thr protein kinase RdoA (MazF antagonist)
MSSAAKAHGLDGTLVDPDWPVLTFDEVRTVIGEFPDIREPVKILSVSPRPFSAASVVSTRGERVFVKRHHRSVRDADGLREEHEFMEHLRRQGAVVPMVYRTKSDVTAVEVGEWTYEVHNTPDGVDLYEDALSWTPFVSVAHAHSAGRALARLHLASEGYQAPLRRLRPLVAGFTIFAAYDPSAEFDSYVAARPSLAEYLRCRTCRDEALELLAPFHAELVPVLSTLSSMWTHNDLHGSNLLWSDAGNDARAVAVIDFGLCDRTNAVHDLAHAIERNIVAWLALVDDPAHPNLVPVHFDHLQALLNGYDSVRPLSQSEAAALAPMTALCHAEFALSETDYFLSVLHSEEKARMACEGYLVEHARWFRGAGNKLLDALRKWAAMRRPVEGAVRR